jgi:hypothetical protein
MNRASVSLIAAALVVCSLASCKKKPTDPDAEPSPSYDESNRIAWVSAATVPACTGVAHAWTWTIAIKENGGADGLTINHLDSTVDGVAQPRLTINTPLPANGTVNVNRTVCHGDGVQHTVVETLVSTYKGQQSTYGNTIALLARPQ